MKPQERLAAYTCISCVKNFPLFLSRNFPFAARVVCPTGVSGDDFWQVAKTGGGSAGVHFGERPRRVTDAQVILLAGSHHRCSVDRADALKE